MGVNGWNVLNSSFFFGIFENILGTRGYILGYASCSIFKMLMVQSLYIKNFL